ncbi:hypothetical protein [Enterococcus faecium]
MKNQWLKQRLNSFVTHAVTNPPSGWGSAPDAAHGIPWWKKR